MSGPTLHAQFRESSQIFTDNETGQSVLFGTTRCPTQDSQQATKILNNLESRVQEGMITVSLNHVQLNVVLRQLILVLQIQCQVTEMHTSQWKDAMRELHTRCDDLHSNIEGLKEQLIPQFENLRTQMTEDMEKAIKVSEKKLEEELDDVIADVNHSLEENNQNIAQEIQRMAAACMSGRDAEMQAQRAEYEELQEKLARQNSQIEHIISAQLDVLPIIPAVLPDEPHPVVCPEPPPSVSRKGSTPHAKPPLVPDDIKPQYIPLPVQARRLSRDELVVRTQVRTPVRRLSSSLALHGIIPDISLKADTAWVKQQLETKVNISAFEAQVRSVDELYQMASRLSLTMEKLACDITAVTGGHVLEEAFELRVESLANEIFRLEKHKADRGELQLWVDKAINAAATTRTGYQCLSCNQVAGPLRTACNRKTEDFPPSNMFVSSLQLQVKGSPVGRQHKQMQRVLGSTNLPSRKKLTHFYDWLHTRADEENQKQSQRLEEASHGAPDTQPEAPPPIVDTGHGDGNSTVCRSPTSVKETASGTFSTPQQSAIPLGSSTSQPTHGALPDAGGPPGPNDDGLLAGWERPGQTPSPEVDPSPPVRVTRRKKPSLTLQLPDKGAG